MAGTARGSGRPADNKIAGTSTKVPIEDEFARLWSEDGGSGGFQDAPAFLRNNIKAASKHRSVERRKLLDNSPYVGRFRTISRPDGKGGYQDFKIDDGLFDWLSQCCFTYEESTGRILPMPSMDTERGYFDALAWVAARWQTQRILALPKSRRMIMSWTARCLDTWDILLHPGKFLYVASEDLEKSEELVYRTMFLLNHIPTECIPRSVMPPIVATRSLSKPGRTDLLNRITIRHSEQEPGQLDSFIQGVSQGDDLRQYGAGRITLEEFAKWKNGKTVWAGLMGTLIGSGGGDGSVVMISTAVSPSHMADLVLDRNDL